MTIFKETEASLILQTLMMYLQLRLVELLRFFITYKMGSVPIFAVVIMVHIHVIEMNCNRLRNRNC